MIEQVDIIEYITFVFLCYKDRYRNYSFCWQWSGLKQISDSSLVSVNWWYKPASQFSQNGIVWDQIDYVQKIWKENLYILFLLFRDVLTPFWALIGDFNSTILPLPKVLLYHFVSTRTYFQKIQIKGTDERYLMPEKHPIIGKLLKIFLKLNSITALLWEDVTLISQCGMLFESFVGHIAALRNCLSE